MYHCESHDQSVFVALLAEGVDRNKEYYNDTYMVEVALLAEGVDRNPYWSLKRYPSAGRPPRGGRG